MRSLACAVAILLAAASSDSGAFLAALAQDRQEVKSSAGDVIGALETLYEKAGEAAAPSVVALKVDREPEPEKSAPRPFANPFGSMMTGGVFARRPQNAWCTGTVIEADGHILTTHFNVSGKVKGILVRLADGREFPASLVGFNGKYDLALLKIEAEGLPVLKPSRLQDLKVGDTLVALGRAPDGKALTVNPGILSAPSRMEGRGVQTDAKLNYGNVGGPLVDPQGRLVALTCKVDTKYAADRGQNSGVGFAVTHDRLAEILPDLKAGRNVAESRRAFLGIEANTQSSVEGVELQAVRPGTAAEKAGLKVGDIIVEFDGKPVKTFEELRGSILRKNAGDRVKVKVKRGESQLELDCELGWMPD